MNHRILVTYASHTGSTAEIAVSIGKTLAELGFSVDCRPIGDKPQIDGYQAVLLGSAVNYGQWLPEAVDFVRTNQAALNQVPVALITVHIQNLKDDAESRKRRLAYLDTVRPLLHPVAEVFFAGRFDRRGAARLLPGLIARFIPTLDYRDWNAINVWARSVGPRMLK